MSDLILASSSKARRDMLTAAGVAVETVPAAVDEASVKRAGLAEGLPPAAIAEALAEMKALRVSLSHPGALVLGADQILVCEGKCFDKPESAEEAKAQLRALRGRRHELISAAALLLNGARIWGKTTRARLVMREFSEDFLESYAAAEGEALLWSVGAYRLEGLGAQLFSEVEGDFFTILGLPLLEVLDFLRYRGVLTR
jgi:septum formation protein